MGAFIEVATALTACGIETPYASLIPSSDTPLQQRLPLAVLKLIRYSRYSQQWLHLVATALTACGIETNILLPCIQGGQ